MRRTPLAALATLVLVLTFGSGGPRRGHVSYVLDLGFLQVVVQT